MSYCKRIFIMGHPGAGTEALGKAVAEKLGWEFIDADFGLELHMGRTLAEMLGKKGENSLHDCVSEILASQCSRDKIVVVLDAAIICNEKNRQLLSSEFVVYLTASLSVQLERVSSNPASLLLKTDLKSFLNKLHDERDNLYELTANLLLKDDNNGFDKHVLSIIKIVTQNISKKPTSGTSSSNRADIIFFHKTLHTPVYLPDQQAVCLELLAQGKTSKKIAQDMNISYRTVEGYLAKAMESLGCSSSKELIVCIITNRKEAKEKGSVTI